MQPFIITPHLISGPEGLLELEMMQPKEADNILKNSFALVCHPHPLHGGTMNNKVVTSAARTFLEMGIPTIRFNYRGVGYSQGSYGNAEGELEDAKAVISWGFETLPAAKHLILAGFSFGSHIAARAAIAFVHCTEALITIAPPILNFDFDQIHWPKPWLIIQGENDELFPAQDVKNWAMRDIKRNYMEIAEASHFFHGKLLELKSTLHNWLNPIISEHLT